jgi:hypothetical protein
MARIRLAEQDSGIGSLYHKTVCPKPQVYLRPYLVAIRVIVAVFFRPPPLAVTTMLDVPALVLEPRASVRVLLLAPGGAMLVLEKFAATAAGIPETLKPSELLKAPETMMLNVTFAVLPAAMLTETAATA